MSNKKKAFTLTELLVVVIVIGVLSAVVLPKFSKVVETRKTTEAEEVMAAIRTEQEARCALNKQYTTDFTSFIENGDVKLAAIPGDTSKAESNNFTYTLTGRRVKATSKDKGYTLQMPSLADGRISCDGAYCAQLNKDYPTRTELEAKADFMAVSPECGPTDSCDDDENAGATVSCECTGTRSRTCNTANGTWTWGECVGGSAAMTDLEFYTPAGMLPVGCGKRTIRQVCRNGAWDWGTPETLSEDTSACHATECSPGTDGGTISCNECGQKTRTCDSNGYWQYGSCTATSQTQTGGSCTTNGYAGTYIRTCGNNGYWNSSQTCRCNAGETRTETASCGSGQSGQKTRTCTCNSDGTETCESTWNTSGCSAIECTADDPNVQCTPSGNYPSNCGRKTHYCDTNTKKWKTGSAAYSACEAKTSACCSSSNKPSSPAEGSSCTCSSPSAPYGNYYYYCRSNASGIYSWQAECTSCTSSSGGGCGPDPTGEYCTYPDPSSCGCYCQGTGGGGEQPIYEDKVDGLTYNAGGRNFSFYYTAISCPSGWHYCCTQTLSGRKKNCHCTTGGWACECGH